MQWITVRVSRKDPPAMRAVEDKVTGRLLNDPPPGSDQIVAIGKVRRKGKIPGPDQCTN
jgi:hypothetical protein